MPDKTWAVTEEDKAKIRELGRGITGYILEHFKGEDRIPFKLIVGAFQYVGDLQSAKANAIADDFKVALDAIAHFGLAEKLEEPFSPAPVAPEETADEKKARLEKLIADTTEELSSLTKEPVAPDAEVEAASITPQGNAAAGPMGPTA